MALSLLLDVEGTTTPVSFVTAVLFPYASAHLGAFLEARWSDPEVRADAARLADERRAERDAGAPPWDEAEERASALAYALWLMGKDRKSTGLKALQGRVWRLGYDSGALVAPVYPDVPRAFARWTAGGSDVSIFSSGSVLAQKLLFARTGAGDLTPFLRAHFDTTTGPKNDPASYTRIASALSREPRDVLFVSDVEAELDAARASGMQVALAVREGAPPPSGRHRAVRSFDEI
jgi:enolase-phosphatase E1